MSTSSVAVYRFYEVPIHMLIFLLFFFFFRLIQFTQDIYIHFHSLLFLPFSRSFSISLCAFSGSAKKRYERSLNTPIQNGFGASPKSDGTHGAATLSMKPVALRKYTRTHFNKSHLQPDPKSELLSAGSFLAFSGISQCTESHIHTHARCLAVCSTKTRVILLV